MTEPELNGLFKMIDRELETMAVCTNNLLTMYRSLNHHFQHKCQDTTNQGRRKTD